MLASLDPEAFFLIEIPRQDGTPEADRLRLKCRYLSVAATVRYRHMVDAATATTGGLEAFADAIVSTLESACVGVVGKIPGRDGDAHPVSSLIEVLTPRQLHESMYLIHSEQTRAEIDEGKSLLPPVSAPTSGSAPAAD